jgi:hypothetical protein
MYFFTTQRLTQLACHPSDRKKVLIFSMLKRFAPALGRLDDRREIMQRSVTRRICGRHFPNSICGGSNSESVS